MISHSQSSHLSSLIVYCFISGVYSSNHYGSCQPWCSYLIFHAGICNPVDFPLVVILGSLRPVRFRPWWFCPRHWLSSRCTPDSSLWHGSVSGSGYFQFPTMRLSGHSRLSPPSKPSPFVCVFEVTKRSWADGQTYGSGTRLSHCLTKPP